MQIDGSSSPSGSPAICPTQAPFTFDTWHEVELEAINVGTANATMVGALDGVVYCSMGVDWSTARLSVLRVGMPGSSVAGASVDIDAIVVAAVPLASRVVVTAGPADGGCVPLTVAVTSTFDGGMLVGAVSPVITATDGDGQPSQWCSGPGPATVSALDTPVGVGSVRPRGAAQIVAAVDGLMDGVAQLFGPPIDGGAAADAGASDAGVPDAGAPDAGRTDAGAPDAGAADGGATDSGMPVDVHPGDGGVATDGGPGPAMLLVRFGCTSAPDTVPGLVLLAVLMRRRRRPRI